MVSAAIDHQSRYVVSDAAKTNWTARTGRQWLNEDDADVKILKCPGCSEEAPVPWTTCGQGEDNTGARGPGLVGQGYGDSQLSHACPRCQLATTHPILRASKLRADIQNLVARDHALPGTVLDLSTGLPTLLPRDSDRLFPSRLARKALLSSMVELFEPGYLKNEENERPNMGLVRDMVEKVTGKFADSKELKNVQGKEGSGKAVSTTGLGRLNLEARRYTRRFMSRYWMNGGPFAVDLVGAVTRQGVFIDKMVKVSSGIAVT